MPSGRLKGEASPGSRRPLTRTGGEAAAGRGPEGLKMMAIREG
jgi:hypothetical protein